MQMRIPAADRATARVSRRILRGGAARWFILVAGLIVWQAEGPVAGAVQSERFQDQVDLVDRKPFDRIYLDGFNRNETLDILPLVNPPRKPFPDREVLVFELADEPGIELEVPYANVVDFKTFNDLLLEESEQLIAEKKYAAAFRNLLFVYDGSGGNRELLERLKKVLYLDARANYENGNYGLALSMFEDLYQRDPRFVIEGIEKSSLELILDCYNGRLEQLAGELRWNGVRDLLQAVQTRYGDRAESLLSAWQARLASENSRFQEEARRYLQARDFLNARLSAGRALMVLPEDGPSRQLMDEIVGAFPLLFVGVSRPAISPDPSRIDDWASRRVGRLTQRRLTELAGFTDEGGRYQFPNGRFEQADELGRVYRFIFEDYGANTGEFGVPELTAHDLASLLIAWADPSSPECHVPWARIAEKISVLDASTVEIRLRMPFVRPEALLQLPYSFPGAPPEPNGPYAITDRSEERAMFQGNPLYPRRPGQQLPEIVEWTHGSMSSAVDALLRGDVDVVDRIPPSDLPRLRTTPGIEVRSYFVPTMHMLVPNLRNDFIKSSMFRIGLLRTIDRENLVRNSICRSMEIDGALPVDSPFPVGMQDNDQIAYAIDPTIRPGVSNYLLGQLLVNAEKRRQEEVRIRKGEDEASVPLPKVVLAYPRNEIASISCTAIASQWRQIGIQTELRELPPGTTVPPDEDYDFLYLEVVCTEPLADADFLFGMRGAVPGVNATVEQIVRRVNTASSWRQASSNLRQLHRQVMNSVAILPLFQLREHYAYRSGVRGIGRDLIYLYQNVDRWSIGPMGGQQP